MITKNKKNDGLVIRAILASDKDNLCPISKKPKPSYKWIANEKEILFVIDKNLDLCRLYANLKELVKTFKKDFNVDLNSFLKDFNENYFEIILNVLIATSFYDEPPFTLKTSDLVKITVNYEVEEKYKNEWQEALVVQDSHRFCRSLQDMPSKDLTPITFVDHVKKLFGKMPNVKISILDKKQLQAKKLNLLLGVNLGSIVEPRLLVIEYKNNSKSKDLFAYVGKGITFDSGGMNIKTGAFMRNMKFDMSGAAITISTVYALAKNNIKTNVVALAALTENLVSPTAIRPDDVITSYSGKTVEIDNTDAEGRLVLADALSYAAKDLKATKLIDVATLTGAMIFSLGDTYSGVWATNDSDWEKFNKVASKAGEFVWRLPLHEDFMKPLLLSKVADMTNSSNDRRAGSSRAACFLKEFTMGVNYIHLDVAITADVDDMGQAVMVRTLYLFAKER